jgi:glycerophosphoryl diester phosphodiesterase
MNRPRLTPQARPEVVGHGGAGDFFPGNSLQSIEKALELGVDRIEVDVQSSADGELVLVHDEKISVDGRKPIPVSRLSTDQLRSSLPGFLTLAEVIEVIGGRVPLMLDIKGPHCEQELKAAIKAHELAGTSSISCEQLTVLRRLRAAFPTMRLGISTGHISSGAPTSIGKKLVAAVSRPVLLYPLLGALTATGATEVMLFHRACSRSLVSGLHRRGFLVNVWTVDRPHSMRRALTLGVDGIITNRPDLFHEEMEKFASSPHS